MKKLKISLFQNGMIMGMFASNGMFGVSATKKLPRNKLAMFLYKMQTCRFGPKNWAQVFTHFMEEIFKFSAKGDIASLVPIKCTVA